MMAMLEIRNLSVDFPALGRNTSAVGDVSLSLDKGEVMALVGESGSGKSVSALACLGLVPTPGIVKGSIKFEDREIIGQNDRQLASLRGGSIAMIFQNPMAALNPFFTIANQLMAPIRIHRNLDRAAAKKEAITALEKVHLPDPNLMMEKYPHQLSGGQLQRVMIALALACKPKLLIADEPTTALDVTVQAQILLLLRELQQTENLAILFITHDLGVVAALCDRIAVMYAGRIVEKASIDTIFSRPLHPYTSQLLASVPRLGQGRKKLSAIEGQVPDMSAPPSGCAFHPRCDRSDDTCTLVSPQARSIFVGTSVACHHPLTINSGSDATIRKAV